MPAITITADMLAVTMTVVLFKMTPDSFSFSSVDVPLSPGTVGGSISMVTVDEVVFLTSYFVFPGRLGVVIATPGEAEVVDRVIVAVVVNNSVCVGEIVCSMVALRE